MTMSNARRAVAKRRARQAIYETLRYFRMELHQRFSAEYLYGAPCTKEDFLVLHEEVDNLFRRKGKQA